MENDRQAYVDRAMRMLVQILLSNPNKDTTQVVCLTFVNLDVKQAYLTDCSEEEFVRVLLNQLDDTTDTSDRHIQTVSSIITILHRMINTSICIQAIATSLKQGILLSHTKSYLLLHPQREDTLELCGLLVKVAAHDDIDISVKEHMLESEWMIAMLSVLFSSARKGWTQTMIQSLIKCASETNDPPHTSFRTKLIPILDSLSAISPDMTASAWFGKERIHAAANSMSFAVEPDVNSTLCVLASCVRVYVSFSHGPHSCTS